MNRQERSTYNKAYYLANPQLKEKNRLHGLMKYNANSSYRDEKKRLSREYKRKLTI